MKSLWYISLFFPLIFISCATTQKPTILSIPAEDNAVPVYYCNNKGSFTFNGHLLYELNSFSTLKSIQKEGSKIERSDASKNNSFLNYPLGNADYSFALGPSISMSGKYLLKANDDFSILKIRLNTNVDVDVVNLSEPAKKQLLTVTVPRMEYKDEKYQIPWSHKDDGFFGFYEDTLKKYYPNGESRHLLIKKDLSNFSISPSERYAFVFASDSLFLYNLETHTNKYIYELSKFLGLNRKFIRAMCWLQNETKLAFAEGWRFYVYNIQADSLVKYDLPAKVFSLEWIDDDTILCVTGSNPENGSTLNVFRNFTMLTYSLRTREYTIIHERSNHEPFTVKPKLSSSGKLILFSEKKLNGGYQVKLMTLDGKNENILADGFLPFWGMIKKIN